MYFKVSKCLRKLFLSAALVFCAPGSWLQIVIGMLFCMLSLKVLLHFQPYANASNGASAETAQWTLLLTLLLALVQFTTEHASMEIVGCDLRPSSLLTELMSVILILGTVLNFILGTAFLASEFKQRQRSLQREAQALIPRSKRWMRLMQSARVRRHIVIWSL